MNIKTAILVDGSFFIKRVEHYRRKYFGSQPPFTPDNLVKILVNIKNRHLTNRQSSVSAKYFHHLYRCFYYDAVPLDLKIHYPIKKDGKGPMIKDFSKEPENICRRQFFELLKQQRKIALRLGTVKHNKQWNLKAQVLANLLEGNLEFAKLETNDFYLEARQKGVDIKLGIDIATLAYEKLVDQIILIAGDSDFVPAAKLARTKGIDFVLDSLRNYIDPSLNEHIDGLNNYDLVSIIQTVLDHEPDEKPSWWH